MPLRRRRRAPSAPAAPLEIKTVVLAAADRVSVGANVASIAFDPLHGTSTPTGTLRLVDAGGRAVHHVVNVMGRVRSCTPDRRAGLARLLNLRNKETPCTASPSRSQRGGRRASRGFTLIETLVTVGIAGVLSSIAYPSLESHVLRARRSDALVSLMQAQLAQERYRANHRSYGDLADPRRARHLAGGPLHDRGRVATPPTATSSSPPPPAGRRATRAAGRCAWRWPAASVVYASGPDAATSNPAAVNRKCWNR